jgi:drug/metabolite transporter (DMT)-like permease
MNIKNIQDSENLLKQSENGGRVDTGVIKPDEIFYNEEDEEENAIIELDQVSILASSKLSLRKRGVSISISRKSGINNIPEPLLNDDIDNQIQVKNFKTRVLQFKGQFLGFISAFLTALTVIIIKKANLLSGTEQVFIRYIIQTTFMLCIAYCKNINIFKDTNNQVKLLFIRAVIGVIGLTCAYLAIQFVNPSDSSAIAQSNVIITILIARILLGELLSIAHLFSIVFTITGVMFISRPTFLFGQAKHLFNLTNLNISPSNITINTNSTDLISKANGKDSSSLYTIGIMIAIIDACSLGTSQVLIRKLCMKKVHYVISTIYTSYFGKLLDVDKIIRIIRFTDIFIFRFTCFVSAIFNFNLYKQFKTNLQYTI